MTSAVPLAGVAVAAVRAALIASGGGLIQSVNASAELLSVTQQELALASFAVLAGAYTRPSFGSM
jgi:hypothetical protein